MILQQSLIPRFISNRGDKVSHNIIAVLIGTGGISLLSQISIPLPFTPVPITGQTLGVATVSLLWGRTRSVTSVLLYLALGFAGVPLFALGSSSLHPGPTTGYLIGMLGSAYVVGALVDRIQPRLLWQLWSLATIGSLIIFLFGILGLALFIHDNSLLTLLQFGVFPFLPGDIIKNLIASLIARQALVRTMERL